MLCRKAQSYTSSAMVRFEGRFRVSTVDERHVSKMLTGLERLIVSPSKQPATQQYFSPRSGPPAAYTGKSPEAVPRYTTSLRELQA